MLVAAPLAGRVPHAALRIDWSSRAICPSINCILVLFAWRFHYHDGLKQAESTSIDTRLLLLSGETLLTVAIETVQCLSVKTLSSCKVI